jgi:hypothetical protein
MASHALGGTASGRMPPTRMPCGPSRCCSPEIRLRLSVTAVARSAAMGGTVAWLKLLPGEEP